MKAFYLIMVTIILSISSSAQNKAALGTVVNNIKAGPLTGNKNLAFGVKNVLQEALQDKGFSLVDRFDTDYVIDVEISFFDIEQTKQGVSVFHRDKNEVVIRMRGTLSDGFGKVLKTITTEDRSSEISTSTLLINEGGQFNSAVQRNAIKKACISVVTKLF
jgi:uncharacterized lipoprotein YajG